MGESVDLRVRKQTQYDLQCGAVCQETGGGGHPPSSEHYRDTLLPLAYVHSSLATFLSNQAKYKPSYTNVHISLLQIAVGGHLSSILER